MKKVKKTMEKPVKKLIISRCKEWARDINEHYDMSVTEKEVLHEIVNELDPEYEFSFMNELIANCFTDTALRESMSNAIAQRRIGMACPCYGDSDEYKATYSQKMREWIEEN